MEKNRMLPRWNRAFALMLVGGLGLSLGSNADSELPVVGPDAVVPVEAQAWAAFNWASYDQDKVVSWGDYQYSVYWGEDRVLSVVRRNRSNDEVQIVRLEDYLLAEGFPESQQRNGHRNTVIGISPGDGRVHISWDHHANDLNYTRSRAGLITEPPEEITAADFEPRQPIAEGAPQRVTYPRFFNDFNETLYFFYRSGGSGSGNIALFEYDADNGSWSMVSDRLFGLEGVYEPWENSESRNAYMHDLLFDESGRLHITWVYREVSRTWASNHDLHYAYSDNQGRSWYNNAGEMIADTREGEQITIDSPGIVVYDIPVFTWIMNQCAMTLDSQNRPHIATYHMEETFHPENLQHDPPADEQHRLNYYHYWRDDAGVWHRSKPLDLPLPRRSTSRGNGMTFPAEWIYRPMIVAAPDDTLIMYFASNDGFMAHVAKAEDNWSEWQTIRLTGPEVGGSDATKPDRRLLRNEGILSFTADTNGLEPGRGFGFVDISLERILAALGD